MQPVRAGCPLQARAWLKVPQASRAPISTLALTLAVGVGCMDTATTPTVRQVETQGVAARLGDLSAAQLHEANPFDWIGRAHNVLVENLIVEFRKRPASARIACERVIDRFMLADLGRKAPQKTLEMRQQLTSIMLGTTMCGGTLSPSTLRKTGFRSISFIVDTTWTSPSETAFAMIDSIQAELEASSDENDVASRLSPFYNTSLGMGFPDSAAVAIGIAVAQNSWDEWQPGTSAFTANLQNEVASLAACYQGNAEEMQYSVDDVTYVCQGNEWRLASNWQTPSNGYTFRTVSLQNYCTMSELNKGRLIGGADVTGMYLAGRLYAWGWGLPGGPIIEGIAIAAAGAWYSTLMYRKIAWELKQC